MILDKSWCPLLDDKHHETVLRLVFLTIEPPVGVGTWHVPYFSVYKTIQIVRPKRGDRLIPGGNWLRGLLNAGLESRDRVPHGGILYADVR